MRVDSELARFVASPVMIIVGTRDAENHPTIGRGVGAWAAGEDQVEVALSAWQWPDTAAHLAANGRMAATFARPADYVSYQLKGEAALRPSDAAELARARRYMDDITDVLSTLGLSRELIRPWLSDREVVVARMKVREIYVQTPGPKAGTAARVQA